jgi:hypothetical protein
MYTKKFLHTLRLDKFFLKIFFYIAQVSNYGETLSVIGY